MNRTRVIKTTSITAARISLILAPLIFIGTFLLYAFIHHQRHQQFLTFGWDLAVFDQPIYLFSRGLTPYSSLMKMHTLGDHFHPLLLLLGGLIYKFWASPLFLLWLQTAIATGSAAVIYLLARKVLKAPLLALSVSVMYLTSVGFQSMVLDDYHDDVLATLPLALIFFFLEKKHWLGYWLSTLGLLLVKEEFGLLAVAIGLVVIFKKISLQHGLATIIVGAATFYLLLEVIMPWYSQTPRYVHYSDTNSLGVMISQIIRRHWLPFITLVDHPQKLTTLSTAAVSFGFLPLISPPVLALPILESLVIRFIDPTVTLRFAFNNHYNGPLIPLLAIAAIYALRRLLTRVSATYLIIWVLSFTLLQDVIFHGPVNSVLKPQFWQTQSWQQDAHELIRQVPQDVSLATQNSLLPHLDQRPEFYLLPEIGSADYIAVDLQPGPNKFYGQTSAELTAQLDALIAANRYRVIWQRHQALLLQKVR